MTWLRGARCTDPEAMPEMEARPPAENRHGGAPRGERPASWDAPHPAGCGQVAPHPRDNRTSAPVGAPPAPRSGTDAITRTNPGAERAAGTMKAALFDIVRRDCGQRLMREPRLRARYDESQPEAVGWVEFLRDPTMAPQGDCCAWRGAQPNATRCWVSQELDPTYDCFESLALSPRKSGLPDLRRLTADLGQARDRCLASLARDTGPAPDSRDAHRPVGQTNPRA
jgi:hypothetical protein